MDVFFIFSLVPPVGNNCGQLRHAGERLKRGGRGGVLPLILRLIAIRSGHLVACVFVVVAVETKQFPVAAVWGIVVVVVVLVVDRKQVKVPIGKVSSTAGTYPGMDS